MIGKFIEPWKLEQLWSHVAGLFQKTQKHATGYYSMEDLITGIVNGTMQCGLVADPETGEFKALVVTQRTATPQRTVLRVMGLAGDEFDEIMKLENELDNLAREMECDEISAVTRPGMAKKLKQYGWEQVGILMRKDIKQERVH